MDGVFVKTVRDHAPAFADSTDRELITLAHQVCDTIAKSDVQTVMQQLASDPTFSQQEMRQAGFFVGAGVAAYCPQYDAQVSAMANGG